MVKIILCVQIDFDMAMQIKMVQSDANPPNLEPKY